MPITSAGPYSVRSTLPETAVDTGAVVPGLQRAGRP